MTPDKMRCVEVASQGGPDALSMGSRSVPVPSEDEVLVRVAAAGVNRPDIFQRDGLYPPPEGASDLLGLEVSGVVEKVGASVRSPCPGERVCALAPGGGYAEYCVVPAAQCLVAPKGLDAVSCAALPETFFTVWFNLFMESRLRRGESLLVHGAASGIGTTAIQLASLRGVDVFATAGGEKKVALCKRLGAKVAIDRHTEDFVEVTLRETEGRGVDVVLDMVGGDYIGRNLSVLAPKGKLVLIAFLRGSEATVDFMRVMRRMLVITGSTMRPQPVSVKAKIASQLQGEVWPQLESGAIAPVVHATYPLEEVRQAHMALEGGAVLGKLVLIVDEKACWT